MKTSLYTVLCIAIRLGAVLMAVGLLVSLPVVALGPQDLQLRAFELGATAIGLMVAFVLWLKPGVLAWWASSRSKNEVFESPIAADQIQYIAFSVLGAWLVVSGLAVLVPMTIQLVWLRHLAEAHPGMLPSFNIWSGLIRSLVMVVAGVILMLQSRGLVGLLHRLRGYPTQPIAGDDDEIEPRV